MTITSSCVHVGDCLDLLRDLPAASIAHVVTDPPYGQSNEKYDGPGAISLDPRVWAECHRVTGPDAALVAFAGGPTYHRIASAIEAAGWKVRQMWGWIYRDGFLTSAYPREGFDRLAPAMDPIVFATKGKVLLRLSREGEGWAKDRERSKASPMSDRFRSPTTRSAAGHWPRSIASDGSAPFEYFLAPRTRSRAGDRSGHPNQKPLDLMRWLVGKLPHLDGRPILDPFAGGGTTLRAAELEGFDAIGHEVDPGYAELASGWLLRTRREAVA